MLRDRDTQAKQFQVLGNYYQNNDDSFMRVEKIVDGLTEKEQEIFDIVDYLLRDDEFIITTEDVFDGLRHIRRMVIPNSKIDDCEDCQKNIEDNQDDFS
jgi:hypothetical protein